MARRTKTQRQRQWNATSQTYVWVDVEVPDYSSGSDSSGSSSDSSGSSYGGSEPGGGSCGGGE